MTRTRSFEELLQAWLADGPEVAPHDLMESVLVTVPTRRQHRRLSGAARRFTVLSTPVRAAAAIAAVVVLGIVGLSLTGRLGSSPVGGPQASATPGSSSVQTVSISTSPIVAPALSGANGRTLYVLTDDTPGTSTCDATCATNWPPLLLVAGETVQPGPGVTGTLATITRGDGSTQVTYDGAPLYYFIGDLGAGDANGQGIFGKFFVASPAGGPNRSPAPAASGAISSTASTAVGCLVASSAGASISPIASVRIVESGFDPPTLTVPAGTSVTWTNCGSTAHTVTAADDSFGSGSLSPGATFTLTFRTPGTFGYRSTVDASMTGVLIVTP